MELKGRVKVIGETATFGNNGFRKREVVITTDEQYPQIIMIEFVQNACDLLNGYEVGQDAKIGINIRGREWVNPEGVIKYFNSIQGWRIDKLETQAPKVPDPKEFESVDGIIDDSLPF